MEGRTLCPDKATLWGIPRTPGAWGQKVIGQERWPRWRPPVSERRLMRSGRRLLQQAPKESLGTSLLVPQGGPSAWGCWPEGGCLWSLCELAPSPPTHFLIKTTGKKAVWGLCLYSCLREDSWDLEIRETALIITFKDSCVPLPKAQVVSAILLLLIWT